MKPAPVADVKVNAAPAAPAAPVAPAAKKKAVGKTEEAPAQTSKLYLALAVLTLCAIAATAVVTTLHYVKFEHKLDYSHLISILPHAK